MIKLSYNEAIWYPTVWKFLPCSVPRGRGREPDGQHGSGGPGPYDPLPLRPLPHLSQLPKEANSEKKQSVSMLKGVKFAVCKKKKSGELSP